MNTTYVKATKADDLGDRVVRFVASTAREDRDGDIIEPQGIQTDEFAQNPVALWAHKNDQPPVGRVVDWAKEGDQFVCDIRFDEDERSELIYQKVRSGSLNAVSIGFMPIEDGVERRDEGGYRFHKVELLEISVVPVPSNRDATAMVRDLGVDYLNKVADLVRDLPDDILEKADENFPPPPEAFRKNCRIGLDWHEQGFSGEGLQESTVRWAERMAQGEAPSWAKAQKMASFLSRHLAQDHPKRDDDGDPTPYAVALKLWGGEDAGPSYTRRLYRIKGEEVPEGIKQMETADTTTKAGQVLSADNREEIIEAMVALGRVLVADGTDPMAAMRESMREDDGIDYDEMAAGDVRAKMIDAGDRNVITGVLDAKATRIEAMQEIMDADDLPRQDRERLVRLLKKDKRDNHVLWKIVAYDDDHGEMRGGGPSEMRDESVPVTKAAVEFQDLPLAARDREWDSEAAVGRWRAMSGSEEEPSDDYRQAFVWYDDDEPQNFGSYKLPIGDVIDDTLVAVPRGVFAAAAAVEGARGGVAIPDGDMDDVRAHLGQYYEKMADEFDDDAIVAPWRAEESADGHVERMMDRLVDVEVYSISGPIDWG